MTQIAALRTCGLGQRISLTLVTLFIPVLPIVFKASSSVRPDSISNLYTSKNVFGKSNIFFEIFKTIYFLLLEFYIP